MSISRGAGFPASGETLASLNCFADCFFSSTRHGPFSNIAIPIGRSGGHLTKSSEPTRSVLRQGRIAARVVTSYSPYATTLIHSP